MLAKLLRRKKQRPIVIHRNTGKWTDKHGYALRDFLETETGKLLETALEDRIFGMVVGGGATHERAIEAINTLNYIRELAPVRPPELTPTDKPNKEARTTIQTRNDW